MGVEIEKKFLVKDDSYRIMAKCVSKIVQGYLNRDPERTVRVRIKDNIGFITVKGKNEGDTRLEFEYEIPLNDAKSMLKLCSGRVLDKSRYYVEFEGYVWEVDEFHGSLEPLTVAEIELPSSDTVFPVPPFIGKEVTGESKYYNSQLS